MMTGGISRGQGWGKPWRRSISERSRSATKRRSCSRAAGSITYILNSYCRSRLAHDRPLEKKGDARRLMLFYQCENPGERVREEIPNRISFWKRWAGSGSSLRHGPGDLVEIVQGQLQGRRADPPIHLLGRARAYDCAGDTPPCKGPRDCHRADRGSVSACDRPQRISQREITRQLRGL